MQIEKDLSNTFISTEIRSYIERNNQLIQTYSDKYVEAYDLAKNGMVQRRFKSAIHAVSSFWYSAWIDAGQPKLHSIQDSDALEEPYPNLENKKPLGREEWHE